MICPFFLFICSPVSFSIDELILSHDVIPFIVLLDYLSHTTSLFYCFADSFVLTTHYCSAIFISIHTLPFVLSLLVYVSPFGNIGIIL